MLTDSDGWTNWSRSSIDQCPYTRFRELSGRTIQDGVDGMTMHANYVSAERAITERALPRKTNKDGWSWYQTNWPTNHNKLDNANMAINSRKSCCLRIGQRHNVSCAPLHTSSGELISWVAELRYLGVTIECSRFFKCSLSHAKKLFYRSANAIFGEIGRIASEEVVLHLRNASPLFYMA